MSATAAPSRRPSQPASQSKPAGPPPASAPAEPAPLSEAPILFQDYFKSTGPRTYAAQVKRARNDNHFIVVTEGKRDDKTGEVRKTKVLIFSEDFESFFKMINQMAAYVRANPVPPEVAQRQKKFWTSRNSENAKGPDK